MSNLYLIVGLGNPGKAYDKTRHNVGFVVLQELARKHRLEFRKQAYFKGVIAEGNIGNDSVLLLMPQTFMNLSGESVSLLAEYRKIDLAHLLIVTDDVAIPLGQLRMRINSGSGGHNGLKSVEEHLKSNRYARLRIGVGDRQEGDLASHVLGRFTEEEEKLLPAIWERAVQAIELWVDKGITSAMNFANGSSNGKP